ncbi:Asp23/Gls24 family envelope stress response protein [Nonomuraea typhae]|uniref:Asp23/Gls24 family envelope stress response protein n=1 Tax=Nonomuraea typhae TaxID=2603600 RepID=UPI0012FC9D77|nr:Asp23/Gls24 family envelope stress response protein [Nonomuraea typhae]
MSTTSAEPVRLPAQRVPAELRGRTSITDRAATRITCRLAESLAGVRAVTAHDGLPWTRTTAARVDGDQVRVRLFVTVGYPAPLRAATRRIREELAGELGRLTGLRVSEVDVVVTHLAPGAP